MVTPYISDTDMTLYVGDALSVLRDLRDESVDCCVTSPPYWGLRDYGTPGQIGLEATPDLFVARMVEVFREVRRVLAAHGTCWVNLGDSYTAGGMGGHATSETFHGHEGRRGLTGAKKPPPGLKPKDLVGIPWRVAFALQADGWYLRSDIIWAKPNPMPESVTDRPTKAHEYVFLLTKSPRYWFDQEAVRERYTDPREGGEGFRWGSERYTNQTPTQSNHTPTGRGPDGRKVTTVVGKKGSEQHRNGERWPHPSGRNVRSVWEIATQPYPEAHFATFPEELPRRCIRAGCALEVCRTCGKPRERIVENKRRYIISEGGSHADGTYRVRYAEGEHEVGFKHRGEMIDEYHNESGGLTFSKQRWHNDPQTVGWSDCGHNNYRPGVVLDPFMGSGTTALVARAEQRHAVGIELNAEYAELAARRTRQLSLLT